METNEKYTLNANQVANFLGLNGSMELLDQFDFSVQIEGSLCPPSDNLVSVKEGVDFEIEKHIVRARALLLYGSDLNGYKYTVDYNRCVSMYFDVNLQDLIVFDGNENTIELVAKTSVPMSLNHYDLDAETYKLTQAGYDAVLNDFVDNVEPPRGSDSVKWKAIIVTSRKKGFSKNELSDDDAMLVVKHAYLELFGLDEKVTHKSFVLPNKKRGKFTLFIGLTEDVSSIEFDLSRDSSVLKMRAELSEGKHKWSSKNVIFSDFKDVSFDVEMVVSGELKGEGERIREGDYEMSIRNRYVVEALVKYYINDELKTKKVTFKKEEGAWLSFVAVFD